jgi:hypothetical protein
MAEVKIIWDGKQLEFPKWMFSRTVWVSVAIGALNVFENVGDLHAFGAQFGIDVQDYWINWINTAGLVLAIWFRINAKQPLGIAAGKIRPLTPEELEAIKAQLKAEAEK